MIQLTRKGVVFSGTQNDLNLLREKYDRDNFVILPQLYESQLLEEILQRVETARFLPRDHNGIGLEFCMADYATTGMLTFFPNNPAFLRLIEWITGCTHVGEFQGRVYQMTSSDGHYDHWHDDSNDHRVVTMSVNLSRQVFGGALQMKRRGSNEIMQEIQNTGLGDALLFRISDDLLHRVQGVMGDIPKTAFAGWFLEVEDFLPSLHKRMSPPSRELANDQPYWEVPVPDKKE